MPSVSIAEAPEAAENRSPTRTARKNSARMANCFIDYGQINFACHKTTELAEFVLAKAKTPKAQLVAHMETRLHRRMAAKRMATSRTLRAPRSLR